MASSKAVEVMNHVVEMARRISGESEFVDELEQRILGRQLIKLLTTLRCRANLTQAELADRLKVSQSKISKLENSDDNNIRLGDLVNYATIFEHEVVISIVPIGCHR